MALFFFLQNFVSTGLGVNVNFLGWWIFQIGLSVARQLFDLYCLFLFWLLFGMYNCILLFFYLSPGDKNRAPSFIFVFLPSFIFVFLHTKIVTCVLGYYLTNSPLSLSLPLGCYFFLSLKLFSTFQFNTHFCVFLLLLIAASLFVSFSSFFFQVLSLWSAMFKGTQARENQSFNFTGY